jgi:hypothetical protein
MALVKDSKFDTELKISLGFKPFSYSFYGSKGSDSQVLKDKKLILYSK